MQIHIEPHGCHAYEPQSVASVSGDTVTHNGTAYDLSAVPEGGSAIPEGDHPFAGPITRENGALKLGLRMAYDTATAEPDQPTDPAHWLVEIESGDIPDLVVRKPVQKESAT